MSFVEFLPAAEWRDYIVAYWQLSMRSDTGSCGRRIYADGCADLICNAGESTVYFYPLAGRQPAISLYPGQLYLGGTMTAYGVVNSDADSFLTGIRFRPGGFYALFAQSMQLAVDSTIEFHNKELCALMCSTEHFNTRLDQWFNSRPKQEVLQNVGKYDFIYLRKRMYESGGLISIEALAGEMCVSQKTLERIFKKNVGISPKEFLRIIRFQEVLKRLRSAAPVKESFLRIAFELGYYDHAHLTNEFRKYAGILPSELSNFYKTGISGGQYF